MGDNVKVYYSINGGSLQQIENGGSVSIPERDARDGSTAIVFYIYITDEAENSGVTFTTDNQAKTLRSITEEHGQAVIEGGNTVGDHDFSTVTNEAYERYGCRYALYYSSFDYDQYGGNNYRGFQVWMNLPSEDERSWVVYHSNISSTEDTTRYQTIDSNTSSVTLWRAVYENEGYTLAGWNTEADGTGTSYELGATVLKDTLSFDQDRTEHLYAVWEQNAVSSHSVTAAFVDENGTALRESQTETFSAGAEYAYTIGDTLPLTIEKDGVQYVYDHLGEESDALSGPVNGDKTITLVYSVDANKNQVPDEYDATVTYQIVNGTWSDGSTADIACLFGCARLEGSEWVYTPQTLGETIPEGMLMCHKVTQKATDSRHNSVKIDACQSPESSL